MISRPPQTMWLVVAAVALAVSLAAAAKEIRVVVQNAARHPLGRYGEGSTGTNHLGFRLVSTAGIATRRRLENAPR